MYKHCHFVITQSIIAPPKETIWLWRLQNMLTGVALASNLTWPVHISILYRSRAVFQDFTEKCCLLQNVQCCTLHSNSAEPAELAARYCRWSVRSKMGDGSVWLWWFFEDIPSDPDPDLDPWSWSWSLILIYCDCHICVIICRWGWIECLVLGLWRCRTGWCSWGRTVGLLVLWLFEDIPSDPDPDPDPSRWVWIECLVLVC